MASIERENGRSTRSPRRREEPSWALKLVDAGIAAALIAVPLAMGGRTPAGQLVFAGTAFWTALFWGLHQTTGGDRAWRNTLAFVPMVAALGLVALQLLELSPSLLQTLSPHVYEVLPLWSPGAGEQATLGTWQTLSLTPGTTQQSFVLLLSGVILFAVTVQRIERLADVERILRWTAISVSIMAAFGIAQFLTSNGKFFWFYEHPFSRTDECVKGSFTNRNHFAQFIALGFGAVLWWVYGGQSGQSRQGASKFGFSASRGSVPLESALKTLLVPLCALAVLMSFSRGGVLALLASGVTGLFLLLNAGKLSRRAFAVLAGSAVVICLGLSIYGYDALSQRFESAKSLASLEARSRLWAAARDGFADYPLCGTGLSSHRFVYPMYLEPQPGDDDGTYYTHAENGYVQILLETGAAGLGLALAAMGFYFFWCAASLTREGTQRARLCFVGVVPPLLANAVHSASDFIWYVPGCMGAVAVLAACACRLYQLEREREGVAAAGRPLPRFAWAGATVLVVAAAGFSLSALFQAFQADAPWNRYLMLKQSLVELNRETDYDEVEEQSESRKQILTTMLQELSRVLDARPNFAAAHVSKALVHRDLFHEYQAVADNAFDLRMIRETVRDNFDSVDAAREWLPRGVGEHWTHLDAALGHAHRAAEFGPLDGEVYLLLAQLAFLEPRRVPPKSAYVDQAFRVRPHHGTVLFEIGIELTLAGRPEEALAYLRRSFQRGKEHQQRLIQTLAGQVPVRGFLRKFQPDADAATLLVRHYSRPEFEAELDAVLIAHAALCERKAKSAEGKEAARYWRLAAGSHGRLDDHAAQRECLLEAIAMDSTNFDIRYALGRACLKTEQYDEAEKHLRWCAQRKPGHPGVEWTLDQAVTKRIASAGREEPVEQVRRPQATASR